MNREQAKEWVEEFAGGEALGLARHVLESLDAIEKRLAWQYRDSAKQRNGIRNRMDEITYSIKCRLNALESCGASYGPVETIYNPPPDDEEMPEAATPKPDPTAPQYITAAECIKREMAMGLSKEEAELVTLERFWANLSQMEYEERTGFKCINFHRFTACPDLYRLPVPANGELPELPILPCKDVPGAPCIRTSQSDHKYYVICPGKTGKVVTGDSAKTRNLAIAHWNKWMRERFWAEYEKEEE